MKAIKYVTLKDKPGQPVLRMIVYEDGPLTKLAICRGGRYGCGMSDTMRTVLGPCPGCYRPTDPSMTVDQLYDGLEAERGRRKPDA